MQNEDLKIKTKRLMFQGRISVETLETEIQQSKESKVANRRKRILLESKTIPFSETCLAPVYWLLQITGINIVKKNGFAKRKVQILLIFWFHLLLGYTSAHIIFGWSIGIVFLFLMVFAVISHFCIFSVWFIMFCRKKAFSSIMCNLNSLHSSLTISNMKLHLISKVLCFIVLFYPFLMSFTITTLHIYNRNKIPSLLTRGLFGFCMSNVPLKYSILFFIDIIDEYSSLHLTTTVSILFSLMYLCLFQAMKDLEEKLQLQLEHISTSSNVKNFLASYRRIFKIFLQIEEITTLPVFAIILQKCLILFVALSAIIGYVHTEMDTIIIIELLNYSANSLLSLSLVIISAGKVHSTDLKIRELFLNIYEIMADEDKLKSQPFSLSFFLRQQITFTAWGVLELKKSTLLKIASTLITYGVILAQFA